MNILPQCCWQFNLMAYRSMPEFHQYFTFGSGFNHFAKSNHMSLKNKMLLLKVCLQFLVKQSCALKRVPISLHYAYTHMLTLNYCYMVFDLAGSHSLYFLGSYAVSIPQMIMLGSSCYCHRICHFLLKPWTALHITVISFLKIVNEHSFQLCPVPFGYSLPF